MFKKVLNRPNIVFLICQIAGFSLLLTLWLQEGALPGFFLLLSLVLLSVLRWRFPKLGATVLIDCALCFLVFPFWEYAHFALMLPLFEGTYRRFYWVGFAGLSSLYSIDYFDAQLILLLVLAALCGVFLGKWNQALEQKIALRDTEASKYYELEHLQGDLMTALPQVERMAVVAERARIARDIHDNAGHEIVAAYISLQTARDLLDQSEGANADALELYDEALARLNSGVNKIRETAHNLQTVTSLGVENLIEACEKFPTCPVNFSAFGDTSQVPTYVWNVLESCLNESLTNAARHAHPKLVTAELDVTEHLVRLCIENDGVSKPKGPTGSGLRNLRQRATAIGGTLSVDAGAKGRFRIVCVIPIQPIDLSPTPSAEKQQQKEQREDTYS